MPIDGRNATRDEMRQVKEICRRIKNNRMISWIELFNDHIGLSVSESYEGNLGKGLAGQDTVLAIYQWIAANELQLAAQHAPALFEASTRSQWQEFIDSQARYGQLLIRPWAPVRLHEFSTAHPLSETRIRIGQEFIFELDSPLDGSALGFDLYEGIWYPLPLLKTPMITPVAIIAGLNGLPLDPKTQQVTPYRERSRRGEHGHCVIVGPDDLMSYYARHCQPGNAVSAKSLTAMAERFKQLKPNAFGIFVENVLFE